MYSLRAKYYSVVLPIVERYADKYLHGDKYASGDSLEDIRNYPEGTKQKFAMR